MASSSSCVERAPSVASSPDDLAHQIVAGIAPQFVQVVRQPVVEALDAPIDPSILPPGQPDVQAGRAELAELQDAGPRLVGHSEDVADHGDGKLRAVPLHDVDGAGSSARSSSSGLAVSCTRSRSAATALVVNTEDTNLR